MYVASRSSSVPSAKLVLDSAFALAPVPRRLFGSFVEHMGRCVYTGIYEPGHPTADEHGLRGDVLELTREIGPTVVRYPGGNFVSNYRWEDGIGPREQRPTRLDLAWHSIETNQFGLHEFVDWAEKVDTEVMMAVNLGTRGLQEACDLLEYTNHPGGTYWSDRRIANGAADRSTIKLWCLGNEMDGPWQVGHKTAAEYGRLANETGKAMRLIDSDIELVACGSSNSAMPTFGAWESRSSSYCYDTVDYISLHAYYEEKDDDTLTFLASAVNMDRFIEDVVATADAVRARGPAQQADQPLLRRVERLVHPPVQWRRPQAEQTRVGAEPAADRGRVHRHRRRGGRHLPQLAAPARRPGDGGQPGSARQRDRPAPVGGGRRCLEADHRLSVRADAPAGPGTDRPGRRQRRQVRLRRRTPTCRSSTPARPMTRPPVGRPCSSPTAASTSPPALRSTSVAWASRPCWTRPPCTLGADQDRHTTNLERHDAITPQRFDDYVLDGGQLKVSLPALSWTVFSFEATRG